MCRDKSSSKGYKVSVGSEEKEKQVEYAHTMREKVDKK